MPEVELELECENCGSKCRVLYDTDQVHYDPENCPFCGEVVGGVDDGLDEDEDTFLWMDDGLEDDDDTSWN